MKIQQLNDQNIFTISWPALFPNLDPKEAVRNSMKYLTKLNYPDLRYGKTRLLDELRVIVEEVWDSITVEELAALFPSKPARYQTVLDANGSSTKY